MLIQMMVLRYHVASRKADTGIVKVKIRKPGNQRNLIIIFQGEVRRPRSVVYYLGGMLVGCEAKNFE